MKDESQQELVNARIENLRPKLLDLSRRNPLISTKLGPRSNSHLRAVDELPDILFFKLNNGQSMDFVPLPSVEDDPRDEQNSEFREAVINARLTDEAYLAAMEAVDCDSDDYLDKTRGIERQLKDRVRAEFGLAPRVQKSEINLSQHAKNNGISSSYDLPVASEAHPDGRHTDDRIQTLLLPNDLERKLNAVISKSRTWIQETGMNVLQVAFGFLEWTEDDETESSFAPLVLLQVEIKRARTPQGPRYSIVGTGEEPELNAVFAEKLRIDFSIGIPKFEASSVEAYLAEVAKVLPKRRNWRVRRQVAIGVFPSARMAMYHDLDPKQPAFPQSEIVQSLLAGSDAVGSLPFADEYEIDDPAIEAKVPCLVMDADSSQFSVLVDVADGKNVSVEGPPGTGKSQTIVNAIAAALADGKKILFVAEKLAALNVVKSRLEAVGLGEFLLPLQAEKSTREQVIESIRSRLDMRDGRTVRDYDEKLKEFRRVRKQLADYIELITTEFAESGLNVHAILGKSILTSGQLVGIPTEVLERCNLLSEMQTASGFLALLQIGSQIEDAHGGTLACKPIWRETQLANPDRFAIEEACDLAKRASEEALTLTRARDALEPIGAVKQESVRSLEELKQILTVCEGHWELHGQEFIVNLLIDGSAKDLASFLDECAGLSVEAQKLELEISGHLSEDALQEVRKIEAVCVRASLPTIDLAVLAELLKSERRSASTTSAILTALQPLVAACEAAQTWLLDDIARAHALCRSVGREALAFKNVRRLDEAAASQLRRLCEEGRQLRQERAALSEKIDMSSEVSLDVLVTCASTLRMAGSLSFLSPSYRKARRLFKSISRSGAYSNSTAIQCLDDLISFRRRSEEFIREARASGLFGAHFRGLDTRYDLFERVARYYEGLTEHFGGPQHVSLRGFLWDSPVGLLDLLPALRATGVHITFASLRSRLATAESGTRSLENAIADLEEVAGVMRKRDVGLSEIQDVRGRLEALLLGRDRADEHVVARRLLGDRFAGHRTNAEHVGPVTKWAQLAGESAPKLRAILSCSDPLRASEAFGVVLTSEAKFTALLDRLSDAAKVDAASFVRGRTLREAADRLSEASSDGEGLFAHATFANALLDATPHGIMPLVEERLRAGSLSGFGSQVEALAIRTLSKEVFAQLGSRLARYRGTRLDQLRADLAELDREIIKLSRRQLRANVKVSARPPTGNGVGRKSTWTNMALIENEVSKKQKFISVRDLTQRAGEALVELKPCWMMSPLAVAQYVPKGSVNFDLCIIDEASQMPPESAIGALLRCAQVVVVGDTNQLPPSSFFKTLIEDGETDEDEAVESESVLEMANGSFRPARRLRWHYRSRHSGLIKFSNRLVYDDNLIVFPSPTESMARMGVELKHVQGRYKAGTNPIEAKAIIEAIIDFMRTDSDRSLGVVTLNQKQRDLIMEEFEYAIANNRSVQKYIDTWKEKNDGLEEFFVKNLENVQGDERDVIFIGTVYGAEEPGSRVMQRFGPINGLAGRRRLNVLFTRAKQKIVTFSSMTAADIEAQENSNPGAYMLKRWLEYAASGVLDAGEVTGREPDSDFEVFVMDQIRAMGCTPVPQVGVAGYFVDIGIRHQNWPHGFVLGVECDGATYHSAKSARDRDRLRQEILEGLGWKLHRIWSTDWFNNSRQEAERLRKAIADRLISLKAREHEFVLAQDKDLVASTSAEEDLTISEPTLEPAPTRVSQLAKNEGRVEVGDTVRVRYLTDDKRTIKVTISDAQSDTSQGIIHHRTPMATALLGAEEGDEVEVLVGSYIRPAVVENILKHARNGI